MTPPEHILVAFLGCGALVGAIMSSVQFFINRNDNKKAVKLIDNSEFKKTIGKLNEEIVTLKEYIGELTYITFSDKIETYLNQGFCTPEQRHIIEDIKKIYHALGFNGDMDARLERLYGMPTKRIVHGRRKDDDEKHNI